MQRVEFRDRLDLKGLWREEVKKMRFGGSVWALWCGFVWSALAGFHIFTHTLSPKASVHAEPLIKTLKSLVHRWEKTLEKGYKAVGFVEVVCHVWLCQSFRVSLCFVLSTITFWLLLAYSETNISALATSAKKRLSLCYVKQHAAIH